MSKSLKNIFLSGAFWTTGQQIIITLLGICQLFFTSRFLSPFDFGIYAICLFFSSLGQMAFSMGFSAALIQKKGNVEKYLNTTWTASIVISIISSVIIILIIPLLCNVYFKTPEAIYPSIVLMLNCLLLSASNPGLNLYLKEIQLKKIFLWQVIAKSLSFIFIIFAVLILKNYWSLIFALLMESFIRLIYSFYLHPFRPKLTFSWEQFKELYKISGWIQLKNITSWLSSSIDTAIVGNILGSSKLGFYNRAQTISSYPRLFVTTVIDSVAFPIYSKVYDDSTKIQNVFNKIQDLIILVISILSLVFILYGNELVLLVLGNQWLDMILPFKIISVAYLIQTLFLSFIPVLRAFGYTKQEFLIYIVKIIILIALLYPLVLNFDLKGAGFAIIICMSLIYPIMILFVKKKTNLLMSHYVTSVTISAFSVLTLIIFNNYVFCISCLTGFWIVDMFIMIVLFLLMILSFGKIFKEGPIYLILLSKNK